MSYRTRHAIASWLVRATSLLRSLVVVFVAVLASGAVHAHQGVADTACEGDDDCTDQDDGGLPGCPEDLCGPAHHCGCCSPLVVTCPTIAKVLAAAGRQIMRPHDASAGAASGVRARVERPPRR